MDGRSNKCACCCNLAAGQIYEASAIAAQIHTQLHSRNEDRSASADLNAVFMNIYCMQTGSELSMPCKLLTVYSSNRSTLPLGK